ncbi:hypothetical protein HZ326_27499 [Fusarium oxysporum f. sp. albedinis]|nr:hypothetical protein HZ326_27499 [Fusarium oxysporum f. sp. albedinis]
MAIRTQTLGITRSLYNTTALREDHTSTHDWYPHLDSSIREPQDEFPAEEDAKLGNTPRIPLPHQKKMNKYRKKKREDPDYRRDQAEKYHANYLEKKEKKRQEREKAEKEFRQQYAEGKIGATKTLGMMREQRLLKQETKEYLEGLQGKGATPNKGKQPEALQQVDNIPVRVTLRDTK